MSNAFKLSSHASGTALLVPTIEGYQTESPASFCFWRSSASRLIICCRFDSSVTRSKAC